MKVIKGAKLIDGTGSAPVENSVILIDGEKILNTGSCDMVDIPADAEVIEASGKCVIPGLIDAHVHVTMTDFDITRTASSPFSLMFYQAAENLKKTLATGVTTVRDAGGADLGMKLAVEKGLVVGPDLKISVSPLSQTGGHGDFYLPMGFSLPMDYPGRPSGICDGEIEVCKTVRSVIRDGADVVKVMTSGGVISPADDINAAQFSLEELKIVVREAHAAGKTVMAHAVSTSGILNALKAGIDSIEHGVFIDDECIELMLQQDSFLVPTLSAAVMVMESAERSGRQLPEWVLRKGQGLLEKHRENVSRAVKAGIKIVAGTDGGVAGHGYIGRELKLLGDIGMTNEQVLMAATKTAAACLNSENSIGTVEPGKQADLLIVDGDPLADITVLRDKNNIISILKNGEFIPDS